MWGCFQVESSLCFSALQILRRKININVKGSNKVIKLVILMTAGLSWSQSQSQI
jgi:hypothetical protein